MVRKESEVEMKNFIAKNLTPDMSNKLDQAGISVIDYMSFRYTAEKIIQSGQNITPEALSFVQQFNTLNKFSYCLI